jgi:S-adenosylmethionine synthetase
MYVKLMLELGFKLNGKTGLSMKITRSLFTSESVTEGHPDKIADQISDRILDKCLTQDSNSKVACEVMVARELVVIAGEITTSAQVDWKQQAIDVLKEIGYDEASLGYSLENTKVIVKISQQSPDISQGVEEGQGDYKEQGAGDQGIMFGYACKESKNLMPLPIDLSHRLTQALREARHSGRFSYLRPDGKAQVTVEYDQENNPVRVDAVVISSQHNENILQDQLREDMKTLAQEVIGGKWLDSDTRFFINPTGRFVLGGPSSDCGLTGRKIIVDTYGGMGRHGGGCFSGKDPSKVDRSGAYAARFVAKNLVASGLADRCEVQLSYAIGYARPLSIKIDTFGTGKKDDVLLAGLVDDVFDLSPKGIVDMLDLKRPIYEKTAVGGHFGRDEVEFSWEQLNWVDALKNHVKKEKGEAVAMQN